MGILSGLKGLFSASSSTLKPVVSEQHQYLGFDIETCPTKGEGGYRVGGVIRKDGQEHTFIRADLAHSVDEAHKLTLFKAKQTIDQLGKRLFY